MDRVPKTIYTGATPIYIGWMGWRRQSIHEPSRPVYSGWLGEAQLYRAKGVHNAEVYGMVRVANAFYTGAKPIYIGWLGWPRHSMQEPSRPV